MNKRAQMLASEVRKIIAPVLRECPPECGMVTITEVEVADDYAHATVLVGALQEPEAALRFLESCVHEMQHALGALKRYRIPRLRFRIDPRGERGRRIDALLEDS